MSNATVNSYGEMGLGNMLTLLFVTLKLVGVITWSWWWVLSPIWIGAGIVLTIIIVALLVAGITRVLED